MLRLDQETADLIAANAVRIALESNGLAVPAWFSVSDAVEYLQVAGRLDHKTASYVLKNQDRFMICPPPRLFDARWHVQS
jgi:hypothetical protein